MGRFAAATRPHATEFATGKAASHFVTSLGCEECHSPAAWRPVSFDHSSSLYPGDHSGNLACRRCHAGNTQAVTWSSPSYQPDCAGCHASDYERDEHKKVESPRLLYSVSELRDCTGACHTYTDTTFTTIRRSRTGEHRVNRGDF